MIVGGSMSRVLLFAVGSFDLYMVFDLDDSSNVLFVACDPSGDQVLSAGRLSDLMSLVLGVYQ